MISNNIVFKLVQRLQTHSPNIISWCIKPKDRIRKIWGPSGYHIELQRFMQIKVPFKKITGSKISSVNIIRENNPRVFLQGSKDIFGMQQDLDLLALGIQCLHVHGTTTRPAITETVLKEPAPEGGATNKVLRDKSQKCVCTQGNQQGRWFFCGDADPKVRSQHFPWQGLGEKPAVGLQLTRRKNNVCRCPARSQGPESGKEEAGDRKPTLEEKAAIFAFPYILCQEVRVLCVPQSSFWKKTTSGEKSEHERVLGKSKSLIMSMNPGQSHLVTE